MGGGAKKKTRKGATAALMDLGKKVPMKKVPSKTDSGRKHGGMLPSASGQSLAGFCHGPGYYTTDEQRRVFD